MLSFLHIDTQVLTSHVNKIVELEFSGCDSIATSETQITFWILSIVTYCNIIRAYQRDTEEWKLSFKQNGHRNILSEWHHSLPPVSFSCHFFLMHLLNGPLEANSEPCQIIKMELSTKIINSFQPLKEVKTIKNSKLAVNK